MEACLSTLVILDLSTLRVTRTVDRHITVRTKAGEVLTSFLASPDCSDRQVTYLALCDIVHRATLTRAAPDGSLVRARVGLWDPFTKTVTTSTDGTDRVLFDGSALAPDSCGELGSVSGDVLLTVQGVCSQVTQDRAFTAAGWASYS